MDHTALWIDFIGKVGPPLFAATLVACLLSRFDATHGLLMGIGLLMMLLDHWYSFHRSSGGQSED